MTTANRPCPCSAGSLFFVGLVAVTACGSNEDEPLDPADAGAAGGSGGAAGDGGPGPGDGGTGSEADFPCDVRAVIESSCQRCHTDPPRNGAPFPLLTWQDTRAEYGVQLVYEAMLPAVESDFMPLRGLGLDPPVEALSDQEKTTLVDWLEAGAPPVFDPDCDL